MPVPIMVTAVSEASANGCFLGQVSTELDSPPHSFIALLYFPFCLLFILLFPLLLFILSLTYNFYFSLFTFSLFLS